MDLLTLPNVIVLFSTLWISWITCQNQPNELNEVCETKTFHPVCEQGHVILMTHAQYGRMRLSSCVVKDYGSLGCGSDVLEITDTWCSGQPECEIPVPSTALSEATLCPRDLKPYLEVTYRCVKVVSPPHACAVGKPVHLDLPSGYITQDIQRNLNCGTATSPYRLVTKPGQQIVLTVYDFKPQRRFSFPPSQCQKLAEVLEHPGGGTSVICRGLAREQEVYRSRSHKVDIVLWPSERGVEDKEYMIHYEVVGCPDLAPMPAAIVTKSGDNVTIKCNRTAEVYKLTCRNNEWTGSLKNCSQVAPPTNSDLDDSQIPYGVSIFIVIIIALVIGLVVLIFGLLFLRRRNHLCGPRFPRPQTEHIDKDYISASYYQTSTYSHKPPPASSDLPPCTPLMPGPEQIYAQRPPNVGGETLACGCPIYMSRDEVQNQQNTRSNDVYRQGNGTTDFLSTLSNPNRLTIGPDMVPINERQIFMNTLPTSPKRLSHSTFKPAGSDSDDVEINGIKAKSKETAVVLGENRFSHQSTGKDGTARVLVTHNSDASEHSDSEAAAFMPRH